MSVAADANADVDGFTCGRCRIWTGSIAATIGDICGGDESAFGTLPGAVQVCLAPARRGMLLTMAINALRRHRAIFISEDSIRTIAVYCPSPFSVAVVLQVDVDEAVQQCFFLSHVSLRSESSTEGREQQAFPISDRSQAIELLSQLHCRLKAVPLTPDARELLAKKRTEDAAMTRSKGNALKRRRTISPSDFYGRPAGTTSTPTMGSRTGDSDSWATFYERLQFNVSHSLMCQLEGTAPLSTTFPRQQEAFEFADQVVAFRQRLNQQRGVASTGNKYHEEPRVFCFEGANEGKRRFWVTTLTALWREYTAIPHGARHVYEIIREATPCRLYFDLEFKKRFNPGVDGDALVTRLISLLQLQLYRQYHLLIDTNQHVVQLESSTSEKFSRHLTIHMPNGELFVDNIHAGSFVRQFIHDLIETHDEDATRSQFLVQDSGDDSTQQQLFIDVGVYTRNRMFRVLGSSKYRKAAVLRALGDDGASSSPLDNKLFLRSIVCPYSSLSQAKSLKVRLLRCEDTVSLKRYGAHGGSISRGSLQPMRSVESKSSIYPALDAFVRSTASTGGVQGEIRAVHLLYPTAPLADENSSPSAHDTLLSEPVKVVYHMMKNRWCENVGRPHKSNNVMFVVDVQLRTYVQRCHDPQCQAVDYRSPVRPLPSELDLRSRSETRDDRPN